MNSARPSFPVLALLCPPGPLRGRLVAELAPLGRLCTADSLGGLRADERGQPPRLAVLAEPRDNRALTESIEDCARAWPHGDIVVIHDGDRDRAGSAGRLLRAGVSGIVDVSELERCLAPTLAAVLAGQVCVPRNLRTQLAPPSLSRREKQALGLVALGLSNGEIARQLHLTESTVKSHLTGAYRKLGVASRAEAVDRLLDPVTGLGTGILTLSPQEP